MIQSIALPIEETLIAEAIKKSQGSIQCLQFPQGFQKDLAWELANLIRIAYGDYERFDHKQDLNNLIQEHDTIWLPAVATSGIADQFWLSRGKDESSSAEQAPSMQGAIPYEVLATFTYLAFNLDFPPKPEVDRFGFILQRKASDNRKDLYIIFRGTMEPSEWFNDFQYKQISFLEPDGNFHNLGEVCLGFNKIYTDYRPDSFIEKKTLNKYSHWINEAIRNKIMAENLEICQQHKLSIKDTVHQKLAQCFEGGDPPNRIHVTGHSLGAALATLCALHAAALCEKMGVHCPIDLYTFASPRVGNPAFAKVCREKLNAFRIANSEDVVPGIPPATLRVVGEEMKPGPHVEAVRLALATLTGGVSGDVFEHVGVPVVFTTQLGEISSNHNMGHTYCSPLTAGGQR